MIVICPYATELLDLDEAPTLQPEPPQRARWAQPDWLWRCDLGSKRGAPPGCAAPRKRHRRKTSRTW